jgi:transposase
LCSVFKIKALKALFNSGCKIKRESYWLHVASNDEYTCYQIMNTPVILFTLKGIEAMDAMRIVPEFKGIAVHDGWK